MAIQRTQAQLDSMARLKAKTKDSVPGAANPNKALYGSITPASASQKVNFVKTPGMSDAEADLGRSRKQYALDLEKRSPMDLIDFKKKGGLVGPSSPGLNVGNTTEQYAGQPSVKFGGLSEGFIKSNPNQAKDDLIAKGMSSTDAQRIVNEARGISPLTLPSGDYNAAPVVQKTGVQSIDEIYKNLQTQFQPLEQTERERIAAEVEAEYAPQREEVKRLNEARQQLFQAQLAQRGDVGFGQSDLGAGGKVLTQEYGAGKQQELEGIIAREKAKRIAEAEGANLKSQQDLFKMATDLRQQQLSETQAAFKQALDVEQNRRANEQLKLQQGQSFVKNVTDLDYDAFSQLDPNELAFQEAQFGLPSGYFNALYINKQNAENSENLEDFNKFAEQQVRMSAQLPEGQTFNLANPFTGEILDFVGTKDATQIVSNKYGIFSVDKRTGKVEQVQSFAGMPGYGGGGGSSTSGTAKKGSFNDWLSKQPEFVKSVWNSEDEDARNNVIRQYKNDTGVYTEPDMTDAEQKKQVWKELADPDVASLPDEDKARIIQSEYGFNPEDFGIYVSQ